MHIIFIIFGVFSGALLLATAWMLGYAVGASNVLKAWHVMNKELRDAVDSKPRSEAGTLSDPQPTARSAAARGGVVSHGASGSLIIAMTWLVLTEK